MSVLALSEMQPFARGKKRLVFAHPDDPGLVVKVMRPDYAEAATPWGALRRDYYCVHMTMRELREHVEARLGGGRLPSFVPRIEGLVDTDLGLGLVVAAARGRDGGYAPTLGRLMAAGRLDKKAIAALERFCEELTACRLVVGDLHAGNVVYAYDREHGQHFVLVDGLGDKTFVPLLKMSRLLNRRAKVRKARKLLALVRAQAAGRDSRP